MLSLLLLHYWKETTERGRRQQRRGEILASWKGGSVFEREHLTPLTPGKRVEAINIWVSVIGKLRKAFPEVWPCAPGGSHEAVLCCLGHFRVWLLVFHFGWIQEPYQEQKAIRNHNTLTMLNWVCLGQTPQYRNSKLALMMWLRSLRQSRKLLQCPAVVQGFSERGALFGLRLWGGCLGRRTDCQAMKTHHAVERRTWKHHAICVFVSSTHTHPKLDECVVWVVIFYWAWPGYYKQQET